MRARATNSEASVTSTAEKNGKKNYSRTTRKAENETQIPIEINYVLNWDKGGRSAPVKIPQYSESVGTNQERFNSGDIVFDIHGTAGDFHRSESWNRYLLIPSHLSALKNEDKRISIRPTAKWETAVPPPPSVPFLCCFRKNQLTLGQCPKQCRPTKKNGPSCRVRKHPRAK